MKQDHARSRQHVQENELRLTVVIFAGSGCPQTQLRDVVPEQRERTGTTEVALSAARHVVVAAEAVLVVAVRNSNTRADAVGTGRAA